MNVKAWAKVLGLTEFPMATLLFLKDETHVHYPKQEFPTGLVYVSDTHDICMTWDEVARFKVLGQPITAPITNVVTMVTNKGIVICWDASALPKETP